MVNLAEFLAYVFIPSFLLMLVIGLMILQAVKIVVTIREEDRDDG